MPDKDKNNTPQDKKDKEIKDNSKVDSGKEETKKEKKSLVSKKSEVKKDDKVPLDSKKVDSDAGKVEDKTSEEKKTESKDEAIPEKKEKVSKDNPADSNYQVSMVDENTLKIKIKTDKGVSLNSSVGGKNIIPKNLEGLLQNINDDQEIEIEISINPEKKTPIAQDKDEQDKSVDDSTKEKSGVLLPNPEVENIVKQTEPFQEEVQPPSDEDLLRDRIGKKSPFNVYRRVYAQNFQIGLVSGVVIYLIAVFSFFAWASKDKIVEEDEQQRLIVLQDLPDPKINLQNIEDPNAPPEEENTEEDGIIPKKIPNVRNFRRGPTIKRPFVENKDTTGTNDTSGVKDTTGIAGDTTTSRDTTGASGNKYPDSLMTNYNGQDIGINMNVPNGWKIIDPKSINTKMEDFAGLILTDTTVQDVTMNLFIEIDKENKPFNKDLYINNFQMQDSSIITYSSDPKELGGNIEYNFYVIGGVKNLKIAAKVRKDSFEKYKPAIESTVSSINFPQPPQ